MVHGFIDRLPAFREDVLKAVLAAIQHEIDQRKPDGPHDNNLYAIRRYGDPVTYMVKRPHQEDWAFEPLTGDTARHLVPHRSKGWAQHLAQRETLYRDIGHEVIAIPKQRYFFLLH